MTSFPWECKQIAEPYQAVLRD